MVLAETEMLHLLEFVNLVPDAVEAAEARIAEYGMSPGHAHQRQCESRAARNELGFGEDADDVAPADLREAIQELRKRAEAAEAQVKELTADLDKESEIRHRIHEELNAFKGEQQSVVEQLEAAQRERDEAVLLRLEVSVALSSATVRYEQAEAELKRRDAQEPVAWISERNLNNLGKQFSVYVKHEPVMVRPVALYTHPAVLLPELSEE